MQHAHSSSEGGTRPERHQGQELPQPSSAAHSFPGPVSLQDQLTLPTGPISCQMYMTPLQAPPEHPIDRSFLDDSQCWDPDSPFPYHNLAAQMPLLTSFLKRCVGR